MSFVRRPGMKFGNEANDEANVPVSEILGKEKEKRGMRSASRRGRRPLFVRFRTTRPFRSLHTIYRTRRYGERAYDDWTGRVAMHFGCVDYAE